MANIKQAEPIIFDFKEIATLLVKKQNLHDGIWALYVEFGLVAANMGFNDPGKPPANPAIETPDHLLPTAIVPIKKIGIVRANAVTQVSVDASVVNPKPKRSKAVRNAPGKNAPRKKD